MVLPAMRAAREAARREYRTNMFRQLFLALCNHEDTWGTLPQPVHRDRYGNPCYSWRYQVLPYLEALPYPWHSDVPWYDPPNHIWIDVPFAAYCLPGEPAPSQRTDTSVWAVTGPGTAFDDEQPRKLAELPPNLILLVEVRDSQTHWMEPGDLDVDNVPEWLTQGISGDGFLVLFADGEIWFLERSVPLDNVKEFFTIERAARSDRAKLLGAHGYRIRRNY